MKFLFFYVFRKVDEVKKIIAGNVLSNLHQSDHDENILITVQVCWEKRSKSLKVWLIKILK